MDTKTPGVYIQEISTLPPSVAQVETAIPAFIGYTETALDENKVPITSFPYVSRIKSLKEFEERFGMAPKAPFVVSLSGANNELAAIADPGLTYRMSYALELYFANGGGPCYICAAGIYGPTAVVSPDLATITQHQAALTLVGKEDEPTILVFPDAPGLTAANAAYDVYKLAMVQCARLGDRVVLIDSMPATVTAAFSTFEGTFRTGVGNNNLKYGISYYPYLKTTLNYYFDEGSLDITDGGGSTVNANTVLKKTAVPPATLTPAEESTSLFHSHNELYHEVRKQLLLHRVVLPPSAAMAGIYAFVDRTRGVWKAPANVSLNSVDRPLVEIDHDDQQDMNITGTGKSVNAIRTFTGKGIMVWGARTLAGNDNEWKYVSVRRFYNMVEESVKKASMQFVFEPNDANTWVKVRAMIENFLLLQWRAGALAGATPEEAFYVRVGLGQTMTSFDILEGRMNVEIGMAVVRPAEFIILKFSHKMQES